VPRRNNRDKRYDPKDYDNNSGGQNYATPSKPKRKRKDKNDKKIYRESQ
jgi:hypothetical protein